MRLAVVIPWFGRELKGGAEQQAWQIASRLAARGHAIEVLTTCCRSHQEDWATNHLAPGRVAEPEGFAIRRFLVEERDRSGFDQVCGRLLSLPKEALKPGVSPLEPHESRLFVDELIKSNDLLTFLAAERKTYAWFILLPYLYGPVLAAVEIVRERAALQPCLHDEAYAYLPEVAKAFRTAGKLLFNSEGELELALRLFGPGIWEKSIVVGEGVEIDATRPPPANSLNPARTGGRYVLYLGRKDAGKNVPMLVRAFRRFRTVRPNGDLRLVLAGNGRVDLSGLNGAAEDAGLVDGPTKTQLLKNCLALFQPSRNESFSRVIMEAWMHEKPVAANGECLATAISVQRSGGGWLANSEEEWAQLFVDLARLPEAKLPPLGQRGRAYAESLADWQKVMERYEMALAPSAQITARLSTAGARGQINQFLPNLSYGDAISNYALWIRDELRELGFQSEIYARYIDPRMTPLCRVFSEEALADSAAVIYHHSVGSEITPHLLSFDGAKALIYHNITPTEFFVDYRPEFAAILQRGRDDLRLLAPHFPLSFGVSSHNALELRTVGFNEPRVLPIAIDPAQWNFAADEGTLREMQDGRTNLLFVGRIAPNKKQDDLLRAFRHYLDFDPEARLIIAGKAEENDPYVAYLLDLVRTLDLDDSVVLTGSVRKAQLAACYRTADLFWSMSEHEGFGVPLIEAMWFDIPVLAFHSSAVPETMGEAGLMFTDKSNLPELAALASLLVNEVELRQKVIRAQRRRRVAYLPSKVGPVLEGLVAGLLGSTRQTIGSFKSGTSLRNTAVE